MNTKLLLPITSLAAASLVLAGCSVAASDVDQAASGDSNQSNIQATAAVVGELSPDEVMEANADYTTVNDDEWSAADAQDIKLGSDTTTITEAGVYRLTGSTTQGVTVEAPDDAQVVLILDNATIENPDGPAINVISADDVAIFLEAGTTNQLADADIYADDDTANAAINADTDLTISGTGTLNVEGNGNDGISSTDDLVILSGTITVDAADDALRGKDSLVIEGGTLELTAGGDALKADQEDDETQGYIYIEGGTTTATAGDDGAQAFTDAIIAGGTLEIDAQDDGFKGEQIVSVGDAELTIAGSTEGLEAANIGIVAGTVDITASDDGINGSGGNAASTAAGETDTDTDTPEAQRGPGGGGGMGGEMADGGQQVEISGGTVTVDAEGDGLDSNGSLTISGGTTTVYGTTAGGNGATDANGAFTITGGTLIAFGSGSMEQSPSTSDGQGWVALSGQIAAGSAIEITAEDGTVVAEAEARKTAGAVLVSNADVAGGSTYTLTSEGTEVGSAVAGEAAAGGMGGGMGGGTGGGGHGPA